MPAPSDRLLRLCVLLVSSLLLPACALFAPPPEPVVLRPPPPARDYIGEVRSAARDTPSVLEVVAIESPAVTRLLEEAEAAESRKAFVAARRAVSVARQIEPENPRVLQYLAEYALREGNWADAEHLALRSYEGSAQLGALCIRNKMTVSIARAERGDDPGAIAARARADECAQKALPRF